MVALFILGWSHARTWVQTRPAGQRPLMFGLVMGLGAVATMTMAVEVQPGVYIDLRATLLVLSGFFGGPVAAGVSAVIAIAFRTWMGGSGVWSGVAGIGLATAAGLICHVGPLRLPSPGQILRCAVIAPAINVLSLLALIGRMEPAAIFNLGGTVALLNMVAIAVTALALVRNNQAAIERDLLLAALSQAPDLTYVKDTKSRFAAVNAAVARVHGFASTKDMIGKTDFDLEPAERAALLTQAEQHLLRTGEPITDVEECVVHKNGEQHWYSTSKVVLRNQDGDVIGLTGVTRDITADRRLRSELMQDRNQLSYAMTEMADGLAMFDANADLVFCNDQYRLSFPLTWDLRRPGVNLRTILEAVVDTGEQVLPVNMPPQRWIASVLDDLHRDSEEEAQLYDGRWLHIRTRCTSDGHAMVVVSDVSKLKQAEVALLSAAEQLKLLADTDALTGLVNRRGFDKSLENEVARSARSRAPLSLLMIDVDHFKAYNDLYGHPAGDECLRRISACLRGTLKRPADIVARYGGEEFVAILPETDEDGAYFIAQAFRQALKDIKLPHDGSPKKLVTVSVGIATYGDGSYLRYAAELVSMADEALYGAKAAGRDRINGWQAKTDARSTIIPGSR